MPITFLASVKSFRSDHEGESVLSFSIPASHKAQASATSDLIEQVVSVTVCSAGELKQGAKARLKK